MDVIKTQEILSRAIEKVIVHPLVLLSVVDHYNRVAKDTRKRVVGVLLGSSFKGTVDVTNSYAVPFEEDETDPSIWFLDHNFHESMFSMFKRINAKEHVVGWYSTGPKLRENDLDIHGLFNDYVPNPVLVIIDVQPKDLGIPAQAYCAVEEVKENATQKSQKVFVHVLSEIAAHEVEEIGVEHLLRDVKDTPISSLTTEIDGKLKALKSLDRQLREIRSYLDLAIDGKLPLNHEILYHLQDVFNLLPNLNVTELIKSFSVKTNDMILVIYLASLIRSVIALHNLINNKVARKNSIMADEARNPPANNPSVRYIPMGGSWSPFDNLEAADRVAHFRQGNPPYYDGKPPKEKLENWLHEMQTRFQASEYVANSWVPLAVIQLRGMAARWWRSIGRDQWLLGWSEFSDLILTSFSPNDEPESPEPMDKETAQYIRFSTIMQCWGHKAKAGESMEDYVQQFEREFLNGSPYDLSDDEKCRMFWLGVPMHIREHVSYHCNDYYRLRTEVLSAERVWMAQRAREQKQVYFRRLEPSSTVVGHSLRSSRTTTSDATTSSRSDHDKEDPEKVPEEDPEENKD